MPQKFKDGDVVRYPEGLNTLDRSFVKQWGYGPFVLRYEDQEYFWLDTISGEPVINSENELRWHTDGDGLIHDKFLMAVRARRHGAGD